MLLLRGGLLILAGAMCAACAGPQTFRVAPDSRDVGSRPVVLLARFEAGLFVARVMIDGRGPYSLLLDTGASVLVLSPAVAEELALPTGGTASGDGTFDVAGAQGTWIDVAQAASVEEVAVGSVTLHGLDAVLIDMSPFERASGMRIDGLLPAAVFDGYLLTFDVPRGTVTLSEGALPANGPQTLALTDAQLPTVIVDIGGQPTPVMIDTGSTEFLGLPAADQARLRFASPPRETGRSLTVAGPVPLRRARLADDVVWATHRIVRPVVGLTGAATSTCGTGLLASMRMTLDRAHGRVRFERDGDAPITTPAVRSSGFGFTRDARGWTVAYVLDGTPAQAAGLVVGDRIERVEGLPATELAGTLAQVIVAASPSLRLTVVNESGAREVVVETITLVE